ncbi:GAF domain-containing protein [Salinibacter ruber]|uniref:GAF domain-containing protein n=1 Tax=Salinibacter ruber TaxID=146919 RepID=UPI002167A236|nr:GAF domain-containing protein [Salinibacter ruber]MCS4101296.1 GAF domain-containing protein [Salinibacter ruber]
MPSPASSTATASDKAERYADTRRRIDALLDGPTDWMSAMATVACELHHSFDHYDWTGFYRSVSDDELLVGPYQGPHGCLHIDVDRGVCGAAARTRETQLWPDVSKAPDHIACQSSTQSEIVVPVLTPDDALLAVLDVDSDTLGAFDPTDREHLEALCRDLGEQFGDTELR